MRHMRVAMTLIGLAIVGCGGVNNSVESKKGNLIVQPPIDTTVAQGEKEQITVILSRKKDKEKGVVKIKFGELPEGVSFEESNTLSIPEGDSQATATLVAAENAQIVKGYEVTVTAFYDGKKLEDKSNPTKFDLTITKKSFEDTFRNNAKKYANAFRTKLDDLENRIDDLNKKAQKGSKELKQKAQAELKDLRKQYDDLKNRGRRVLQVTEDKWEEFRRDSDQAAQALENGIRKALAAFED